MVDGHGTGLLTPTIAEQRSMIGSALVIDSHSTIDSGPRSTQADLSSDPHFPAVGDQGAEGSCAGWAVTYYNYGFLEAKDQDWEDASLGNPEHLLSPGWTFNKVKVSAPGSYPADNAEILTHLGACTLARLPYSESDNTLMGDANAWREAPLHRAESYLTSYFDIGDPNSTIDLIKQMIDEGYPVNFGLKAEYLVPAFDGDYIVSSAEYSTDQPNHAQTIVGYDDSVTDDGDVGAFHIVNSWGATWGDGGYYWMTYEALELALAYTPTFRPLITIIDRIDYAPTMLAECHFDQHAPDLMTVFKVTIGSGTTVQGTCYLNMSGSTRNNVELPRYMCMDISKLQPYYDAGAHDFKLSASENTISAKISSFRIETYDGSYTPGRPSRISSQATGLPKNLPCTVSLSFPKQATVSVATALDFGPGGYRSYGICSWVATTSKSVVGGSSMQSGDVADENYSYMAFYIAGPGTLTFKWSVSSEADYDYLYFFVDGEEQNKVSGNVDWKTEIYDVLEGEHWVGFLYYKDQYVSAGDDCGYVDRVSFDGSRSVAFAETFDSSILPTWTITDANPASGTDCWGRSSRAYNSYEYSLWCAQVGDSSVNSFPNAKNEYYDQNQDSQATCTLPDVSSMSAVKVQFSYVAVTGTLSDYLCLRTSTNGSSWMIVWTQPSASVASWTKVSLDIPSSIRYLQLWFHSDGSVGGGPYVGAFVDDVFVSGTGSGGSPISSIIDMAEFCRSSTVPVNYTASAPGGAIAYIYLHYRHASSGPFTKYTTTDNTDGKWTSSPILFFAASAGGDGLYQFYTIAVDINGNEEGVKTLSQANTTVDTTVPVTTTTLNGISGSNGWFLSSVNVTLVAIDAGTGIQLVRYRIAGTAWQTYSSNFTVSHLGTSVLEYQSSDLAGNWEAIKSSEIKIDTLPPSTTCTPAGTLGADGWYTSIVSLVMAATDADSTVQTTRYRIDGGSWLNYTGMVSLDADGVHSIEYYSTDVASNAESPQTLSLKVDRLGPVTVPTIPGGVKASGWYASTSLQVSLAASDLGSGVQSLECRLDGGAWTSYSASLTVTGQGIHTLEFFATDNIGNVESAKNLSVNLDNIAPTASVSVEGTMGQQGWIRGVANATLSGADSVSGVDHIEYRIDGGAWTSYATKIAVSACGQHIVECMAIDKAGNQGAIGSYAFKIDNLAPTLSLSVQNGLVLSSSSLTLTWTATDDDSGVSGYRLKLDSGDYHSISNATTSTSLAGLSDGAHTLIMEVTDVAGNVRTQTVHFQVKAVVAGTDMTMIIVLAIAGLAAAAAVGVIVLRRRGGTGRQAPPPVQPAAEMKAAPSPARCPNCGAETAGLPFCGNCGRKL